jgi:chemosensory pili system protein ChpA (sensor histidine kinase/response regulator)
MVAKRLRPKFQLALLGWIKGGDSKRHLNTLSKVSAALENSSTRDDMYQLWWVISGVLESLQNGGLETSIAIKRLLGQTDRQLKYIIDEGLLAFDRHPVNDLLNNLLYYVARSSSSGPRISEIRSAFNLAELLPGDEQVEEARDALSAPSAKLMETVASAIKEDLSRVKDVLDIFVRTGMNKSSELLPQLELLKKISDTLGVLGLGELRGDVNGEIDRLRTVVDRGGVANDNVILDIASTLLRVEDRLDQQLVRLTAPRDPDGATDVAQDQEFQKVIESVMRECIINLARIKETISQSYTGQSASLGLDGVPSLIRGIKSGLLLLDKTRAMQVVDRIGGLVTNMLNAGGPQILNQKETDRLADVIVSIEYYMETVKAGRSEPWYMLDNAEACLAVLGDVEDRLGEIAEQPDTSPDITQKISIEGIEERAGEALQQAANRPPQATEVIPMAIVSRSPEHVDPELIEIFIEEAKEEIASIKRNLPVWAASPDDMEALITVRRSFHTLKGSGRMVGAELIGEYCWAVEDLLNRLINRTLQRTPPMIDFIQLAAAAVPELVEQLEAGTAPDSDIKLLIARANAFADGDPNAAVLTIEATPASESIEEEPVPEMDPVLYDIFSKETTGHLKVITDYLTACEGHEPPFDVTDKLYRACHTLHGSANMANVERGVAVASALNRFVRRVYDHKIGFQKSGLDTLRAAARAIETIVGDINNVGKDRADYTALIDHINKITDTVRPTEAPPEHESQPVPELVEPVIAEDVTQEVIEEAEYDAEIAAIFTEESAELLEEADEALISWSKDRSAKPMEELKRHLHTLKGGARMAGITAMGNLSHELETLLISVDEGRVKATPAVEDLLQRSIDELHRMRDTVISGKAVKSSSELEQRIKHANAGFEVADDVEIQSADVDVETALPAEFSIEPEDTVSMVIVDSELIDELAETAKEQDEPEPEVEIQIEPEPEPEPEPELEPEPEPEPEPEQKQKLEPEPQRPPAAAAKTPAERRSTKSPESRQEFARIDAELLGLVERCGRDKHLSFASEPAG